MTSFDLDTTIEQMTVRGKGILAADESNGTCGKRFNTIGVENTEENRRTYRSLLATTPNLGDYVCGVILFSETFDQKTDDGTPIPEAFLKQGIVPGIKVDQGLIPFTANPDEKITQGLDGLPERLESFKAKGAQFAKWRAVFSISDALPTQALIQSNAELLARYASICQSLDIVPIVEPEVLMDGTHDIETCADITEDVLHEVFSALYRHDVFLENIILKPNMVIPGKDCPTQCDPDTIANWTIQTLCRHVPAAVPTINFLSGGQSSVEATDNLAAMHNLGDHPWYLSFSYGRALQENCLKAWGGQESQYQAAQQALFDRARANGEATLL